MMETKGSLTNENYIDPREYYDDDRDNDHIEI